MNQSENQRRMNLLMGKMFSQMRMDRNVSQESLGENIITQKAISKFEQNGEMPNKLVLDALVQRMGKTMDYFTILLSKQEYEYFVWRRKVLRQIQCNSFDEPVWEDEMAKNRALNENLQEQFVLFWKSYLRDDTEKMKQAIALTVDMSKDEVNSKSCIGSTEMAYLLLYFEKKAENMELSDEKYLRSILRYIVENYEEHEMLKVLGKATCLYGSYAVNTESSEKILYYKKAVELQRKLGRLEGMEDLLRGLLRQYELTGQAPEEDYGSMLQALTSIRKELGINDKSFMAQEISSECVLLHEVLRDYRQERNLSVRQIDEKACSEKTYRALEKGKRGANHSTYDLLAELMDIQIGRYNADIVSDKYSDYKLAAELIAERQSQNRAKSMEMLDELEKSLGEYADLSINRQFIQRIRNVEDYYQKRITSEEFLDKIDETIRLTIPEWKENYGTHFYTKGEVILVYHKAMVYEDMGKIDEAMEIIEGLWKFYEKSEVDWSFHVEEVILIMVFWKELFVDKECYEKSLEIAREGVRRCFESGRGIKLNRFVLELGWSIEQGATELDSDVKARYIQYYKWALSICKLYRRGVDEEAINNYCKMKNY